MPRPRRTTGRNRALLTTAVAVSAGLAVALSSVGAAAPATAAPTAAQGTVVRTISEGPTGSVVTWLRTPDGRAVRVAPPSTPSSAPSVVRIAATTPTPPSGLVHTVTVVLARPPGTTADAMTAQTLTSTIEKGVSSYWSGQSGGRIRFDVTRAVGWTAVTATCADPWALWHQAAAAAGFTDGPRKHLLVYVADDPSCAPGLGTIGATPDAGGSAYVRSGQVDLLAHELGHNLGLGHSNGLQCGGAPDAVWSPTSASWSRPCTRTAYRDWYDVMGVSWGRLGTLSTAHAYRLGLLGSGQVSTLTASGVVVLSPVGSTSGVVSARVQDPGGGTYVVEYRPAAGLDAWLGSSTLDWRGLRAGVVVRRVDPTSGSDVTQTLLLDPTPSPAAAQAEDFDQSMVAGSRLTTGSGRVVVTVVSIDGRTGDGKAGTARAVVTVTVDGASPDAQLARLGLRRTTVNPAPVAVPWRGTTPVHP